MESAESGEGLASTGLYVLGEPRLQLVCRLQGVDIQTAKLTSGSNICGDGIADSLTERRDVMNSGM